MRFKQFLKEANSPSVAEIVHQKILSNLDSGHVDYSEDKAVFNVGHMIKDHKLKALRVVFRKTESGDKRIRYAVSKNEEYSNIVIDTPTIPERLKLDDFLEREKIAKIFIEKVSKFLEDNDLDTLSTDSKLTRYEQTGENNKKENFEKKYYEAVESMKERLERFRESKQELEDEIAGRLNYSKQASVETAIEKLAREEIGTSLKEFRKIFYKELDHDFYDSLDKELKQVLNDRLENFYEEYIEPELK